MTFTELLDALGAMADRCNADDLVQIETQRRGETSRLEPVFGIYRAGQIVRLSTCTRVSDPAGGSSESRPSLRSSPGSSSG